MPNIDKANRFFMTALDLSLRADRMLASAQTDEELDAAVSLARQADGAMLDAVSCASG